MADTKAVVVEQKPFIFEFDGKEWKEPIVGELYADGRLPDIIYITPKKHRITLVNLLAYDLYLRRTIQIFEKCCILLKINNEQSATLININCEKVYGLWTCFVRPQYKDNCQFSHDGMLNNTKQIEQILISHDLRLENKSHSNKKIDRIDEMLTYILTNKSMKAEMEKDVEVIPSTK